MKKSEFMRLELSDAVDVACDTFNVDLTSEDTLKEYIIHVIQEDNFGLALHLLEAIYHAPMSATGIYLYDYSMGTLETPRPITDIEDLLDYIDDDDFDKEDEEI